MDQANNSLPAINFIFLLIIPFDPDLAGIKAITLFFNFIFSQYLVFATSISQSNNFFSSLPNILGIFLTIAISSLKLLLPVMLTDHFHT